jgi:hypothetical protein
MQLNDVAEHQAKLEDKTNLVKYNNQLKHFEQKKFKN